jgi:hypothetical protein
MEGTLPLKETVLGRHNRELLFLHTLSVNLLKQRIRDACF